MLKSIKDAFEVENMQTQQSALGYRIDLYLNEYTLVTEVGKLGHNDKKTKTKSKSNRKRNWLYACLN